MPYGLTKAQAVFQVFIHIFRDLLNSCLIVYVHHILIYSKTTEDHVAQVRLVLTRLITAEKYKFHHETITFLGYVRLGYYSTGCGNGQR